LAPRKAAKARKYDVNFNVERRCPGVTQAPPNTPNRQVAALALRTVLALSVLGAGAVSVFAVAGAGGVATVLVTGACAAAAFRHLR